MSFARSPSALFWTGVALFLAAVAVRQFTDADLLGWFLLCGSFPPILEARAWRDSAGYANALYAVEEEEVWKGAYSVRSAVPRFALLYAWLFGILIGREANVLPDNGWTWVIVVGPMLAWAALTWHSHRRNVMAFISARGISKRPRKRRR